MQEENLNIQYHTKILLIKALNKYRTIGEAASALGISERQVFRLRNDWDIEKQTGSNKYFYKEKIKPQPQHI